MLGYKQPLGDSKIGYKKPLGSMLGTKKPLSNLAPMDTVTRQLEEQKKIGGLERAKRGNGANLGQWA